MVMHLLGSSMAEENDLGKTLMTVGALIFMVPFWTELPELWFLSIIGAVIFIFGAILKSSTSPDTLGRTAAVEINQHLPTSKAVDFLGRVVGIADNPDTAVMSIGKQPDGTNPTLAGILSTEFVSEAESYSRSSNVADFRNDEFNEFAVHGHERVLPLEMADPVSCWFNPEDEWANPTKYW